MTAKRGTIHVLTGCTATGKTRLALDWAVARGAEIVSCDSLLFYRGMDIGTAKPTSEERARVPHHLVDLVDVGERMDIKRFVRLARLAVQEIVSRGRPVLVTGGSGFYLKAFFAPVVDEVAKDSALRRELESELVQKGLPVLVERLSRLNGGNLPGVDVENPRRVIRALERCLATGLELEELSRRFHGQSAPFSDFEMKLVEITREPEELRGRIVERVRAMLALGLVDEVRRLRGRGLESNPSAARAIGYREVLEWLDDGGSEEDLVDRIAADTWRLVRKQRTWFRSQLPPHRLVDARTVERSPTGRLFA